jgi:formate hydrogenlyase subunit 6/NADH:ubiquinone oxidoreductase subunit I
MSIFSVLIQNLTGKPATLGFTSETPPPKNFRGPVKIQAEKCIGCGMCAYVCVSYAVRLTDREGGCEWRYLPGKCTFCGRCASVCPAKALRNESGCVPAYLEAGELDEVHMVQYPICPECGKPARQIPDPVLLQAFGELTEKMKERMFLCQKCRRRRSQKELWASAGRAASAAIHSKTCEAAGDNG